MTTKNKRMTTMMRSFIAAFALLAFTACGVEVSDGKIRDVVRDELGKQKPPSTPAGDYEATITLSASVNPAVAGFEAQFGSNFDPDGEFRWKPQPEKGRLVGGAGNLSEERLRAHHCLATDVGKDPRKCGYVFNARWRMSTGEPWQYAIVLHGGQEIVAISGVEVHVRGPKPVDKQFIPNGIGGGNARMFLP